MSKYSHKEAFCLMKYACSACKASEVIWNSRDGVTPFSVPCRITSCKGVMSHVDWHLDYPKKNVELHKGQRYFVTLTADRAHALAFESCTRLQQQGLLAPEAFDARVVKISKSLYGDGCQPDIAVAALSCTSIEINKATKAQPSQHPASTTDSQVERSNS